MTPTMERSPTKTLPEHSLRAPLVLIHFEAQKEPAPSSVVEQAQATIRRPLADRLYEYGIIAWMVSIVIAIAACLTQL